MLISICIPVYNGEKFLRKCLDSIANQSMKDFEIIVVDDCSSGCNENEWNCKKICKVFTKETKVKVNYLRNSKNLGSLEARRTAVYEAKGDYIFCVDCDDVLEPDCLERLANTAIASKAEIIHCGAKVVPARKDVEEKANLLFEGELKEKTVFDYTINSHNVSFYLWGKLIKRDVFISALEIIPPCYCVFGEDYLVYFYITYFAKSYVGIKNKLYVYSVDTGISSSKAIDTMEKWEKFCSTATVFSIIFESINNGSIFVTPEQKNSIQTQCNTYVLQTFRYLKCLVSENIREEAYRLFCDYWGSDYVAGILKASGETI